MVDKPVFMEPKLGVVRRNRRNLSAESSHSLISVFSQNNERGPRRLNFKAMVRRQEMARLKKQVSAHMLSFIADNTYCIQCYYGSEIRG